MARRALFFAALAGSLGIHTLLAGLGQPRAPAPMGGDTAGEVALGTSFADLAAGVMESTRPEGAVEPPRVETLDTAAPTQISASPTQSTERAEPDMAQPAPSQVIAESMVPQIAPAGRAVAAPNAPALSPAVGDVAVLAPVDATQLEALSEAAPVGTTPAETMPDVSHQAARPTETLAPVEARDTIQLTRSLRPVLRPPPRRDAAREAPARAAEPARRGNTTVNATRGQSSGSATGQQSQSNQAQQTTARRAGQAEISSFNAGVASRVARAAGRLRSGGNRGDVRVAITISASGGLAGVSVVSSSGNPQADALALKAVRRAAPFASPPQGSTQLRVTVQLRR